ncbi:MAG TPA: hypothetical protein VMS86_06725 [Thermoanaerobaculia bacterium]|nr:hypothetical protein [Thermoanaerobaculia bacterium]
MRSSPRRLTVSLAILLSAALCLALAPRLAAHLFWPTFHSAKSAVSLDDEKGLQAVVVIEVPAFELLARFKEHYAALDLMAEIEAGRFEELETKFRDVELERFAGALALEIDGRSAPGKWRPVETPINGKGTEGFFVYLLEFAFDRSPRLGERVEVRLLNRALPGVQVVMANVAEAAGGWRVAESSIPPAAEYPELPEGAEYSEDLGLWSIDETKRDLRVVFARPAPGPSE